MKHTDSPHSSLHPGGRAKSAELLLGRTAEQVAEARGQVEEVVVVGQEVPCESQPTAAVGVAEAQREVRQSSTICFLDTRQMRVFDDLPSRLVSEAQTGEKMDGGEARVSAQSIRISKRTCSEIDVRNLACSAAFGHLCTKAKSRVQQSLKRKKKSGDLRLATHLSHHLQPF